MIDAIFEIVNFFALQLADDIAITLSKLFTLMVLRPTQPSIPPGVRGR